MRTSSRSVAWEQSLALATLFLISLIAAGPLWGPGLLNTRGGGDSPFLLLRTHQLAVNLRDGVFPARWMPDAAYGFGYPFFSYYAALPYYLAAGFSIIGLDILTAIKLTQTLFFAAAALAMYGWAQQVLRTRPGAWLAAVAYTSVPFHLVNVYVRGDSLSEFAAFAFYPLVLWGLDRLVRQPGLRRAVPPALAYAALITTHNVSALIFSPFILLYVVFHVGRFWLDAPEPRVKRSLSQASLLVLPLLMGLLLSAWFWLPALQEMGYVQLDAQVTGYFFYANHFRSTDLIQWRPLFNYTSGLDGGGTFAMGLAQVLLTAAGALAVGIGMVTGDARPGGGSDKQSPDPDLERRKPGVWILVYATLGLVLSTWLITPLSRGLWDQMPLLPMAQFPWRFLSVQAVFTALLSGALINPLTGWFRWVTPWVTAAVLGLTVTVAGLARLQPEYLPIRAEDVSVDRLQLYELFTGNIGSTIRHEYLPRWVTPRPHTGPELLRPEAPPAVFALSGEVLYAERVEEGPTRRVWKVYTGDSGSEVAFPLYYWPGWQAAVNGAPVDTGPAPASGYLSLNVPPGQHTVEVWLGRTGLRLWCEIGSLIGAIAVLGMWVLDPLRSARRQRTGDDRKGGTRGRTTEPEAMGASVLLPIVPFTIILALLLSFYPRLPVPADRTLTMDFERMPYLHHNPDGVTFDGWRMLAYEYDTETLDAGETLQVTLHWQGTADGPAEPELNGASELRLVSPAAIRDTTITPVAQARVALAPQDAGNSGDRATVSLPVPSHAAPGLYFPQVVDDRTVTLHPVWIGSDGTPAGKPVLATFAGGTARLHGTEVAQPAPDRLSVQLEWSTVKPIPANYGLSLRLTDPAGNEWLRQGLQPGYDTQPGFGYLPTSLWPVDRLINDHHSPTLVDGAPPGDGYTLTIDIYSVSTWESVGRYAERVRLTEVTTRPDAQFVARLGQELGLNRLEVPRSVWQGDPLELTAYWVTLGEPSRDYTVEWRVQGPGELITSTHPLAAGSSPADWPAGAWVAGRTRLPIAPTAPPGDYTLELTLHDAVSGLAVDSYTYPETVEIRERQRVWDLPSMDRRVEARFGEMLELAGYDLRQGEKAVDLTLHWQALAMPDQHYMFFVHLADPETGRPVTQFDAMPKGFTYPTGAWATGEVVSDDVKLSLHNVPAGRYDLVIGWYNPDTERRLPAVDRHGTAVSGDGLRLPDSVIVP